MNRYPIATAMALAAITSAAPMPAPQPDWGAISDAKQAESDRYYGRGHSEGHKPPANGVAKRRASRKAQRRARKAARWC